MDFMTKQLQSILPEGWDVNYVGDLICPCGDYIELDGECSEGHVSPLMEAGLI